jgi:hypothetical protein
VLRRAAVVLVVAALAPPGAAQAENLTIQVTSVVVKVTAVDKKPKGTSRGDRLIQRNKLINTVAQFGKPKGARVGIDEGTITFTSAHTERYDGVARLPDGTIRIKGEVRLILGGGIRIPIVGGTGKYADATGTLYVAAGEERVLNVYRLTLPGNVA